MPYAVTSQRTLYSLSHPPPPPPHFQFLRSIITHRSARCIIDSTMVRYSFGISILY